MSTTAVRMTHVQPHSASAYVPRSSRPSSPGLPPPPAHLPAPPNRHYSHAPVHHQPQRQHHRSASVPGSPAFAPRMQDMERRGSSHLRHEVTDRPPRKEDMSEGARAILKMLSSLPAPLPESLPATFLPSPNPTPSPPSYKSFSDYARSPRKRKASEASDEEAPAPARDGLGLGISMNTKRQKSSTSPPPRPAPGSAGTKSFAKALKSPELHRSISTSSVTGTAMDRSLTPVVTDRSTFSPAGTKKELSKSSLRNELAEGEDLGSWSKEKFLEAGAALRARALLLKRHGDAYQRSPTAQPKFVQMLPADPLRGLLCLTDAVLLWLFAYWLEEQTSTRIRASPYNESQPLREFVRRGWESEMRKAEDEDHRERAKAMVGLMHLIEAVVCYHLNSEQLAHITRKTKELNSANATSSASAQGPSPPSSSGSPGATGPSPAAQSTHSNPNSGSPESHTSQGVSELLPIITTSTSATHRAHTYLLTSRHHLSLRVLRTKFPDTFDIAIHSELADEALPAPGDPLGAAKRLDIDVPERFAWPIELGMHCPVAHTAVFGRCMVNEYGKILGGWELKLA